MTTIQDSGRTNFFFFCLPSSISGVPSSAFPAISLGFLLLHSQLYLWGSDLWGSFCIPSYISGVLGYTIETCWCDEETCWCDLETWWYTIETCWCDLETCWYTVETCWCDEETCWCDEETCWCDVETCWCDVETCWCDVETCWCDEETCWCDEETCWCDEETWWCDVETCWCDVETWCDLETCWCDVETYVFLENRRLTSSCVATLVNCFKFGMMLSTTNLYSLIPVWMTLMFTQGHRVTGKLELVQSFCWKVTWSSSNVDYVREMPVKKSCKCGDYGSFEHLLFLL